MMKFFHCCAVMPRPVEITESGQFAVFDTTNLCYVACSMFAVSCLTLCHRNMNVLILFSFWHLNSKKRLPSGSSSCPRLTFDDHVVFISVEDDELEQFPGR